LGNPPQLEAKSQQSKNLHDGKSIEIGRFDNRQDADFQLNALLDIMDNDSKVVNLELKHGFDYAVKKVDGSYTVSIEPFVDPSKSQRAFPRCRGDGVYRVCRRRAYPFYREAE